MTSIELKGFGKRLYLKDEISKVLGLAGKKRGKPIFIHGIVDERVVLLHPDNVDIKVLIKSTEAVLRELKHKEEIAKMEMGEK